MKFAEKKTFVVSARRLPRPGRNMDWGPGDGFRPAELSEDALTLTVQAFTRDEAHGEAARTLSYFHPDYTMTDLQEAQ